jgi:hypothetical protein
MNGTHILKQAVTYQLYGKEMWKDKRRERE